MSHTAAAPRLLSLLSLLQLDRGWTGTQLSERLQVSARTVRSDIDRLRGLGYEVVATPGGNDGYRLGRGGASIPPLLLDAEEAVAVAVGLRTGVNCIIGGMEETSLRALTKLERFLPERVRHRVTTLNRYTVPLPAVRPTPVVDPDVLTLLANMCHRHERLRFFTDHPHDTARTGHGGDVAVEVEPYRLVNRRHRWYLLGFDVDAHGWGVYEVDAIRPRTPAGPRFQPRALPDEDVASYVASHLAQATWRCQASVTLHCAADDVEDAVLPAEGTVAPIDRDHCALRAGAQTYRGIALVLARLDVDFTIDEPAELVTEMEHLADRLGRGAEPPDARTPVARHHKC